MSCNCCCPDSGGGGGLPSIPPEAIVACEGLPALRTVACPAPSPNNYPAPVARELHFEDASTAITITDYIALTIHVVSGTILVVGSSGPGVTLQEGYSLSLNRDNADSLLPVNIQLNVGPAFYKLGIIQ